MRRKKIRVSRKERLVYQDTWNYGREGTCVRNLWHRLGIELCILAIIQITNLCLTRWQLRSWSELSKQIELDLWWGPVSLCEALLDFPKSLSWHKEALNIRRLHKGVCSQIRLISFKTREQFPLNMWEFF